MFKSVSLEKNKGWYSENKTEIMPISVNTKNINFMWFSRDSEKIDRNAWDKS